MTLLRYVDDTGRLNTRIVGALREFVRLQSKYAKNGASDTEPDTFFQAFISCAVVGGATCATSAADLHTLRFDCGGWGLFNNEGSEQAVADLSTAAWEVDQAIRQEGTDLDRAIVKEMLWRITWTE